MKGLGVEYPGQAMMKWQQFQRWGMHLIEYASPRRIARVGARSLATGGFVVAGVAAGAALLRCWGPGAHGAANAR